MRQMFFELHFYCDFRFNFSSVSFSLSIGRITMACLTLWIVSTSEALVYTSSIVSIWSVTWSFTLIKRLNVMPNKPQAFISVHFICNLVVEFSLDHVVNIKIILLSSLVVYLFFILTISIVI